MLGVDFIQLVPNTLLNVSVDFLYTKLYLSLFYEFVGVTLPILVVTTRFYRKILNRIRRFVQSETHYHCTCIL